MREEGKEIRTRIILDIASEMEDTLKNNESTLRYCVEEDLKNNGYDVYYCELQKNDINFNTLQEIIDKLTKEIDMYQNKLNKLITNNKIDCQEESRQQTKINGMRIAREIVCKMYRE
ncbi:MAG: hypothetical protein LIR50_17570 [Bacillota bacterium]|nr:hypothetical protein [Bacillota bacterium]